MNRHLTILPGDGIGPEVTAQAVRALDAVATRFSHHFTYTYAPIGGVAYDETGEPLPAATLAACRASDAVLLGAVGGPAWETLPVALRPEAGLLGIRKELGLFANLRPATCLAPMRTASPLKATTADALPDLLIVRELTGGLYFGKRGTVTQDGIRTAFDTMTYSETEILRIGELAFTLAMQRSKRLCSVDKANVLDCSRLWRDVMHHLSSRYPEVAYRDCYVDNCAMQLIENPASFDVIVTGNLFGDILSDEAATLTGSIGMLPSACLNAFGFGLYEPVHGSAPTLAGQNCANPCAAMLSAAMLLRYSFGAIAEATAIEKAVETVLAKGLRTADLAAAGEPVCTCSAFGDAVVQTILAG